MFLWTSLYDGEIQQGEQLLQCVQQQQEPALVQWQRAGAVALTIGRRTLDRGVINEKNVTMKEFKNL